MHTIFMNSKNSKTSEPHRLLLILSDKLNLKRSEINLNLNMLKVCRIKSINRCHVLAGKGVWPYNFLLVSKEGLNASGKNFCLQENQI